MRHTLFASLPPDLLMLGRFYVLPLVQLRKDFHHRPWLALQHISLPILLQLAQTPSDFESSYLRLLHLGDPLAQAKLAILAVISGQPEV